MADPGFPRVGGANPPGGRQHKILPNFPKSYMKLKEFALLGRPKPYYVDPPLLSGAFTKLSMRSAISGEGARNLLGTVISTVIQ